MATDLLIWDWNGTILDDVALCNSCLNQLLEEFGYEPRYDRAAYKEIFDFPIIDYYRRAGFNFEVHPYSELADRFVEIYSAQWANCPLCAGVQQALQAAENTGMRQIILSASQRDALTEQVEHFHLSRYFDELIGQDDFYAHGKLEAGKNWMKSNRIAPSRTVLIGDSLHDAQVANALGIGCVLCAAGHQSKARLETAGVPVIETLQELPALLEI